MARTRRSLDERGEGAQVLAALRTGKMASWQHERLLAIKWGLEGGGHLGAGGRPPGPGALVYSTLVRPISLPRAGQLAAARPGPGPSEPFKPRAPSPPAPATQSRPFSARGRRPSVA